LVYGRLYLQQRNFNYLKPKAEESALSYLDDFGRLSILGELPLETGVDGRRNSKPLILVQDIPNCRQLLRPRADASSLSQLTLLV